MKRIYIPESMLNQSPLIITGEYHHQIGRVLRSRPGDPLAVICGDGYEYEVIIHKIEKNSTYAEVACKKPTDNEPSAEIILYQGNLKGKSLEDIIPSLVYLGVTKLIPLKTLRSEGSFDSSSPAKRKRLDGIIQKAASLCHRTKLMDVNKQLEFEEALINCKSNLFNLIFWESQSPVPLKKTLEDVFNKFPALRQDPIKEERCPQPDIRRSIGIFIGPEGGFDKKEIEQAEKAGVIAASLGRRILDAKTAPVAAITALLYELGEI